MRKILIVDDDVDIVALVVNRLKRNNYEVVSSSDGENGYKKAIQFRPDLIIMDLMMPNLSGGEAVALLKSNDITKDIPVLFFTALAANSQDTAQLDEINVNGRLYPALTKPFDPNKLLSAIKSLLNE
jgi:CheY-like chemotaxis protein